MFRNSVLVPIEKWEKLGQKNEPVKEVLVKTVPLKNQLPQMKAQVKNHLPQMKEQGNNQLGQGTVTTSFDHQIFPRTSLKRKNKSLSLLYYLKKKIYKMEQKRRNILQRKNISGK